MQAEAASLLRSFMQLLSLRPLPLFALRPGLTQAPGHINDLMRTLETKIPPPVVMVLFGGIAWAAAPYLAALSLHIPHCCCIGDNGLGAQHSSQVGV